MTLAVANPVLWYLIDRSKPGFALSSAVGIVGTLLLLFISPDFVPMPAIHHNEQVSEKLGVYTWLSSILFCTSLCFGAIGRKLQLWANSLQKSDILLDNWAYKYICNISQALFMLYIWIDMSIWYMCIIGKHNLIAYPCFLSWYHSQNRFCISTRSAMKRSSRADNKILVLTCISAWPTRGLFPAFLWINHAQGSRSFRSVNPLVRILALTRS